MTLKQLHHFVLAAEERNLVAAAQRANITQPALSNSLRALEQACGVQLFERGRRPLVLSAMGQEVLALARKLLLEGKNFEQGVRNLLDARAGTMRVGYTPNFAASLGGRTLVEWSRDCGRSRIEVSTLENHVLVEKLRNDEFDFIVCDPDDVADPEGLQFNNLPAIPGGFFCRAGHPILETPKPDLADVMKYRLMSARFPPRLKCRIAESLGVAGGFDDLIVIESNNHAILQDVLLRSDSILIALAGSLPHLTEHRLAVELPIYPRVFSQWSIVTRRGKTRSPQALDMAGNVEKLILESAAGFQPLSIRPVF